MRMQLVLLTMLMLSISLNAQALRESNPIEAECTIVNETSAVGVCESEVINVTSPPPEPRRPPISSEPPPPSWPPNRSVDENTSREPKGPGTGGGTGTFDDTTQDNSYPSACVNTPQPSCEVYEKCFAKLCNCNNNSNEYFVTYGKKYCQAFLSNEEFSEVGKKWRDNTLKCLQEKILPSLPAFPEECDCELTRELAIKTHIECYTQGEISMCSLGYDDISQILKTVESKDMLDGEGRKTILPILKICYSQISSSFQERIKSIFRKEGDFSLDVDGHKFNDKALDFKDNNFFKFP